MSNFVSNLLSALVGAAILAIVPWFWTLSGSSSIFGRYNWIYLPTPNYIQGSPATGQGPTLDIAPGQNSKKFYDKFRFKSEMRLIYATIENSSDERSKQIEIINEGAVVYYLAKSTNYSDNYSIIEADDRGGIKLDPINPGEKSKIIIFSDAITISDPKISLLTDGKKMPFYSDKISDKDYFGIAELANKYPTIAYFYTCTSAMMLIFAIFMIPITIYSRISLEFAAKITQPSEMMRWAKIIEVAKKANPEKASLINIITKSSNPPQ